MKLSFIHFVIFLSIWLNPIVTSAQESEITQIREIYNSYNELIEQQGVECYRELPLKIVISSSETQRAIGPVVKVITMYWDVNNFEVEEGGFEEEPVLRKVIIKTESVSKDYLELMFDNTGSLIFAYATHEGNALPFAEVRCYYKEGELIRIIVSENAEYFLSEEDGDLIEGKRDLQSLNERDRAEGALFILMAEKYISVFTSLLSK